MAEQKKFIAGMSGIVVTAVETLFLQYPLRTSLGVVVGLAAKVAVQIFSPLLQQSLPLINLNSVGYLEYSILGLFLLHIPTVISASGSNSTLGENEERAFSVIRRAKAEGAEEWQIQRMYINLCEKVLERSVVPARTENTTKSSIENG